jgi:transposase
LPRSVLRTPPEVVGVSFYRALSSGLTARSADVPLRRLVAVAVDVGKSSSAVMACDFTGCMLVPPTQFAMTRTGMHEVITRIEDTLPADVALVRVGVESTGHYYRPLVAADAWPSGWEVVTLNPAHVAIQRRANGQRGVKTDAHDLVAIVDLLLAGRGMPVTLGSDALVQLTAWAGLRLRRVKARKATKAQLLGQLDQAFPGLTLALRDVLGTKVGRLIAAEFADPTRLARLGEQRFRAFAAHRGLVVQKSTAARLVAAARTALPTAQAEVARSLLTADQALLAHLEDQIAAAERQLAALLPDTPYAVLTSVPGWGVVRAAQYAAAVGSLSRWPSAKHIYRASGLTPAQYESAGQRHDGGISGEGSVVLRRALLDLGIGLWHQDTAAQTYAASLRARGKPGGVIACALAHRGNRIAYALVRDQQPYDPARWS